MKRHSLIVVLEDIRSALNVGAIFRTCDAVLAEELLLIGITPYPPHPRIPKTALGATESVPWKHFENKSELINYLKNKGYSLVSVELTDNSKNIYNEVMPKNTALIFGNEISGVSEELLKASDKVIQIPMYGIKESLNVATTVGITAYEYIRQNNFKNQK